MITAHAVFIRDWSRHVTTIILRERDLVISRMCHAGQQREITFFLSRAHHAEMPVITYVIAHYSNCVITYYMYIHTHIYSTIFVLH